MQQQTKSMTSIGLSVILAICSVIRYFIEKVSDFIFHLVFESSKSVKLEAIKDDILLLSATELASKIRLQRISSEKVVRAFIKRIKSVNGTLNAVVDERFDEALKDAKNVDIKIKEAKKNKTLEDIFKNKPFLGVPFTVKDCIAAKGLSYSAGLYKRKGFKADFDATVIENFKKAGAISLGKVPTQGGGLSADALKYHEHISRA